MRWLLGLPLIPLLLCGGMCVAALLAMRVGKRTVDKPLDATELAPCQQVEAKQ